MAAVFGIGNPLLDIQAEAPAEFLSKYDLKPADCILAEAKHIPIYEDLQATKECKYIAGGACQNSIRACQWLLGSSGSTTYVGAVGDDVNGEKLLKCAKADGVDAKYYKVQDGTPTGVCAVIITDKERSMVTNLEAANKFQREHLDTDAVKSAYEAANVIYCTGFFLTVSPESLLQLGKHGAEANKPFIMNLSAPFLVDFFFEPMSKVLPYTDYVIANETEAATFGKKQGWGDDLAVVAEKLAGWDKVNSARSRTVIFTQGAEKTIVFSEEKVREFHPLKVDANNIVDTNGAGDSFVGGFLAGLSSGASLEQCVESGHYVASVTIQCSGTNFEGKTPDPAFQR